LSCFIAATGELAMDRTGFYRKPDKRAQSICLSCFLTVMAKTEAQLNQAEEDHRKECANRTQTLTSLKHDGN
jgi:hypothetical protein